MKQPQSWMSIVFALGFAVAASAQSKPGAETNQANQTKAAQDPKETQEMKEARQDAGAQRAPTAQSEGEVAAEGDESRARTWRHLYGIQVDGVRLSALDKTQVTQLQQTLQEQGYYTAKVDGVMGPKTRVALRQYYLDQAELALQDLIMPQSAASLGLDEADIERVRGEDNADARKEAAIERTRGQDDLPSEKSAPAQPAEAPAR